MGWLVSAGVAFAAAVALHALVVRRPYAGNGVTVFLASGALVGVALAVHELWRRGPGTETAASLVVYALACELYIFVFTLVGTSVSAALLITLADGALAETEIAQRYDERHMVEGRLARLLATGLLRADDGACALTARGRALAAAFSRVRRLFGHAP